jgi:GNAT superfamily N-acetyltransferase
MNVGSIIGAPHMWYRVFGSSDAEPAPAGLAAHLHARGFAVEPHFRGDDLGWTAGELRLPTGSPVLLARYLAAADDLRDDLNAHAAELETMDYSPNSGPLMARVIQTKQLVTLRKPVDAADEVLLDDVLEAAVRFLAAATAGVYQIDGRGWFAADGELLVREY